MAKGPVIVSKAIFECQEAVELFKLYAEGYNEADIEYEDLCYIVEQHGQEFKREMKNILLRLKYLRGMTLKS